MLKQTHHTTFIDVFVDFAFKRLFSTEESKPILIGLLNHLFKGRKYIIEITYGKNEHHGENDTELDKWLYALKHLTEFKKRPEYLSGPEFDQLFNLASYANLSREEREMYNSSLKRKWDNKNELDYAVKTAVKTAEQDADRIATERERAKAEKEKTEIILATALKLKANNIAADLIAEATGLSIKEINSL